MKTAEGEGVVNKEWGVGSADAGGVVSWQERGGWSLGEGVDCFGPLCTSQILPTLLPWSSTQEGARYAEGGAMHCR